MQVISYYLDVNTNSCMKIIVRRFISASKEILPSFFNFIMVQSKRKQTRNKIRLSVYSVCDETSTARKPIQKTFNNVNIIQYSISC